MGQPAAKKGDKIMAVDIHIVMVPAALGAPVPTPGPHPFAGILDQGLSPDVLILGQPAATKDSIARNMPPHLPIPPAGSFKSPPSNQGPIVAGSPTVLINGKPAARNSDKAMT